MLKRMLVILALVTGLAGGVLVFGGMSPAAACEYMPGHGG
jgi:hypothetical protein